MPRRFVAPIVSLIAGLMLVPITTSAQLRQPGLVYDFDRTDEKPAPPPKHDISGVWEPALGPGAGIQGKGALAMGSCEYRVPGVPYSGYAYDPKAPIPDCLRPAVEPPYTALGRETLLSHVPTEGYRMVPSVESNDPEPACNPQGFPRIVLHLFRTSRIIQTPDNVAILYELNKKWRAIWTDGRKLPENPEQPTWGALYAPESRWWGYSVGRWEDDYTFVGESNGFNDKTWIDNAGLPHSAALHVEERYHRVDRNHLEMTIIIDDPKMYTKPWVALNKLRLRLQSPSFDIPEEECSPLETEEYNKMFASPAAGKDTTKQP